MIYIPQLGENVSLQCRVVRVEPDCITLVLRYRNSRTFLARPIDLEPCREAAPMPTHQTVERKGHHRRHRGFKERDVKHLVKHTLERLFK